MQEALIQAQGERHPQSAKTILRPYTPNHNSHITQRRRRFNAILRIRTYIGTRIALPIHQNNRTMENDLKHNSALRSFYLIRKNLMECLGIWSTILRNKNYKIVTEFLRGNRQLTL